MAQKTRTRARMCLLGVSLTLLPILGVKSPENPNIGAWIDVFKPNGQNIESFMLSKLLHRFQPNFAPFFHQVVVVGGPNRRPTNPRWRTAAILKKSVKSLYLCNRLTDFDEIWHDDAYWPPTADRRLNFEFLKIQDGGSRHLENHKNRDISATVWPIFMNFGTLMQNVSLNRADH